MKVDLKKWNSYFFVFASFRRLEKFKYLLSLGENFKCDARIAIFRASQWVIMVSFKYVSIRGK